MLAVPIRNITLLNWPMGLISKEAYPAHTVFAPEKQRYHLDTGMALDLRLECADSQIAVRGGWGYSPSTYPASR
jgi:hypothetical protein